MFSKGLAVAVILLFIGMSIVPSTAVKELTEKPSHISFNGNTLYVGGGGPNNYTKIQDAINDSFDGDSVFVYDDSSPYYEYILIDKSISLVGENRGTTIIDGEDKIKQPIIRITADGVILNGFKIQDSYYDAYDSFSGIAICSNNNNIFGNFLTDNAGGIVMSSASNNKINDNIINKVKKNGAAIRLVKGKNNELYNNIISDFGTGMEIVYSSSNKIYENSFTQIKFSGIRIVGAAFQPNRISWYNKIYKNKIIGAENGIVLHSSYFNFVYMNEIKSCREYGFSMYTALFNFVMKNNFIENFCNAYFFGKSISNCWIRNYWDDWDGSGFYQINGEDINIMDPEGDNIKVEQYDWFPAREPYDKPTRV